MNGFTESPGSILSLPIYWHLCGIALVACLFFLDYRSRRSGFFVIFLWNLVGVLLHELTHFMVGMVLLARPTGFSIIPRKQENGYQLGAVSFNGLNAFNSLPTGLAPLGLIAVAVLVFKYWTIWFYPTFTSTLGIYFVMFVLIYNSLPSIQDLKIAFGLRSLFIYAAASILAYRYISGH